MKRIKGLKLWGTLIVVFISLLMCVVPLAGKKVMALALHEADVALFYRVRFEILGQSPKGQYYIRLFDTYGREITQILMDHPSIAAESISVLMTWQPNLEALVNGHGDKAVIAEKQAQAVSECLDHISKWASPELKSAIASERLASPLEATSGMTMNQAWVYLNQDARFPQASDASSIISILSPRRVSVDLEDLTLPENPSYSISFDPNAWEFLAWDNGVGVSWEFTNRSLSDCVLTVPTFLSDPYSVFDVASRTLGNNLYATQTPVYPGFTLLFIALSMCLL